MPTPEEAQRMRELLQYEGQPLPDNKPELAELNASIKALTEAKERAALRPAGGSVVVTLQCTRCKKDYRTEEPLVELGDKKYPRKLCYACVVLAIIGDANSENPPQNNDSASSVR